MTQCGHPTLYFNNLIFTLFTQTLLSHTGFLHSDQNNDGSTLNGRTSINVHRPYRDFEPKYDDLRNATHGLISIHGFYGRRLEWILFYSLHIGEHVDRRVITEK
jgi:hypothetical protein